MAFERKEDCARALAMCGKNMFLIGNSARPVVVEMARTEVSALSLATKMISAGVLKMGPYPTRLTSAESLAFPDTQMHLSTEMGIPGTRSASEFAEVL